MKKIELEYLKEQYLCFIEDQGKSKKTVENYARYLSRFLLSTQVVHPKDITIQIVEKYRTGLNSPHSVSHKVLKNNTQNYHLTALRRFLAFLSKQHVSSLEPEKVQLTAYTSLAQKQSMSEPDIRILLHASQGKDVKSLRDRAILLLLSSTGVRVSELCALNVVNFSGDELMVQGTGVKARNVLLPSEVRDAMRAYLDVRNDTSEALFVNNGKRVSSDGDIRLSVRQIERIIRQCGVQVGLHCAVTPQRLRCAYAQEMFKNGADAGSVQELLGHQHIATTKGYTKKTTS